MENMFAGIVCFAVTITTTWSMAHVDTKNPPSNPVVNIQNLSLKDEFTATVLREKRMVNYLKLGKIVAAKLLKGATPTESLGRKFRNYKKDGDIGTAFEDFYSVHPVKVYDTETADGVKVLRGTAGDRGLALYSKNHQGFPVLDIEDYKYKKTGGRYIDRIVYSKGVMEKYDD